MSIEKRHSKQDGLQVSVLPLWCDLAFWCDLYTVGGLLGYFVSAWVSALSDLLALKKEQLTARVRSKSVSCCLLACLPATYRP